MSKLLPCPFCGSEPEFQGSNPYDQSDDVAYTVFCRGCGTEQPWRDTPEDAIGFWNRRHAHSMDGWMPIGTAPKNTKVLAGYFNELGNWRTVTACYHTRLEWSDEYGDHEEEYAPEAWYEESDSAEIIFQTASLPTHWQSLPSSPTPSKARQTEEARS